MRDEIERELGPEGKVTYDNYRSLVQVQAVFSEGLRLHPSVPKVRPPPTRADCE